MTHPVPTSESGYSNAKSSWWPQLGEEKTPELVWPKSVEVYDQMRRQDAQVMSVLRAVTLPIRRTSWRIDPNGARDEVVQLVSEDLGLPILGQAPKPLSSRTRDRFSWGDHLRLALLMLPFGHAFFEQKARMVGPYARLQKLAYRPPRTISGFDVAQDGGLIALRQYGLETRDVEIPVHHLVAYVNEREGGNWTGQSLLRPAYKFWLLKDRALRTQAQTLDRNGLGIPVYTAGAQDEGLLDALERQAREKAEVDAGATMAARVRGGENAGLAVRNGASLELKGVTGTLPDADPVIRYYDEQIARAVLAHFLNLGTETGSWALGSTFADFFTLSLQTVAEQVADVTTQHVVEDLVDWNWGPDEPAPKVTFDEIGSRHGADAKALADLIGCRGLTPDDALEQFIRTMYGLPAADPATARPLPAPAAPAAPAGAPDPATRRPAPAAPRRGDSQ